MSSSNNRLSNVILRHPERKTSIKKWKMHPKKLQPMNKLQAVAKHLVQSIVKLGLEDLGKWLKNCKETNPDLYSYVRNELNNIRNRAHERP